jgi:MoaA/NifB/PqqE/SkfB family radical SAM enzyme
MNSDDLLSRKGFCILPFVHACVFQHGYAQPCCMNHLSLGNTKTQSIEKIYSDKNKNLTDFRKTLLGDSLPVSCVKCEDIEKHKGLSYRNSSNYKYGHLLNHIDISSEEALVNNKKIFLWDIRFSNLCNLKCVICGPADSSRIAEEENGGKMISAFNDVDEFVVEFEKQIDHIVEINFAGGEPLLIKDHYKILELLIKHEKFDVVLRYNTNGTTISLGDKNVIEYWKYFKNVRANFSLDAGWKQFEYLRYGSNWEITLEHLRKVRDFAPHVSTSVNIVIMALNVLYIRQMYEFLLEEKIINNGLNFIPVFGKDYYRINVLPNNLKEKVLKYYQDWEDSLNNSPNTHSSIIPSIQMVKNIIINDEDTSYNLPILKEHTLIKDKQRGTDFYTTFPELKDIFNNV